MAGRGPPAGPRAQSCALLQVGCQCRMQYPSWTGNPRRCLALQTPPVRDQPSNGTAAQPGAPNRSKYKGSTPRSGCFPLAFFSGGFAADSLVEEDGFEPSVPPPKKDPPRRDVRPFSTSLPRGTEVSNPSSCLPGLRFLMTSLTCRREPRKIRFIAALISYGKSHTTGIPIVFRRQTGRARSPPRRAPGRAT